MAKDPAFLFYSQDFIVGVQTMTHEDRGKYITILCQMHQQGRLDEETIRFMVGSVSDKLRLKFKQDERGLWYNERLELETARRNNFTESRRINGKSGGRPKKAKASAKPKQKLMQNHMDNHMGNVNEDVNVIDNRKGVQGENKFTEQYFAEVFDSRTMGDYKLAFPHHDLQNEMGIFKMRVRSDPGKYQERETGGIRQAFTYQLSNSKNGNNGKKTLKPSGLLSDPTTTSFGKL